jgi:regulator of replication initiation timing
MTEPEDIVKQLKAAFEECARLREENERLRSLLNLPAEKPNASVAV